ncbi:alpha/beta fold hydrolase [Actinomyces naeslundii]|uniref:alpha/beta fold hydrolase n=1 Tax=Actinomyces naeslundii TaxID=1655 RepID=UPI00094D7385|nr:alpha/beta fold hydrolase [Actinomyces naeslundii]OLO84340.1 alpha/beta hydrolase [Actinomyces naeslundii]
MDVTYALDLDAPAIGFRRLSSNRFLNLQANRWLVTERAVADFLPVVPRTTRIADWVRTYLDLADRVRDQEHDLEAAFFARGAEFFMQPGNPLKAPTRRRFVSSLRRCFALEPELIPFEGGFLPAYELLAPGAAEPPASTWVVFGGFDSYIEETFPVLAAVAQRGRRVIAFEGPGQGGALEADAASGPTGGRHLAMRADWAAPLSAVLDHFDVDEATVVGMSLGGGLVMHAAASEPRVRRVVAFDALDDFLEVLVSQALPPTLTRGAGRSLAHLEPLITRTPTKVLNRVLTEQARRSPVTWWGMWQGMHVTGTHSPAEFLRAAATFSTAGVSPRVAGDVLLLRGAEDEFVPLHQMVRQAERLTAARSVTTRTFTRAESAASHCQTGNAGLMVRTILAWEEGL